ncbi:MAG: GNAT family N-acetyltransferase [Melioribacteraceae bacterium]|nr:GNAT family N-acetyltransferase [Melioribacteraceae bacterium]
MIIKEIIEATSELHSRILYLLSQLTKKDIHFTLDDFNSIVNSKHSILIGAFDSSILIGVLTLVIVEIPTSKSGRIEDVVVDEKYRGKGIGEKLTFEAIRVAEDLKLGKLLLTSNPKRIGANKLYQKIGFQLKITNSYFYDI